MKKYLTCQYLFIETPSGQYELMDMEAAYEAYLIGMQESKSKYMNRITDIVMDATQSLYCLVHDNSNKKVQEKSRGKTPEWSAAKGQSSGKFKERIVIRGNTLVAL